MDFTLNGCGPQFALWSFVDLGYLTYYVSYLLATGALVMPTPALYVREAASVFTDDGHLEDDDTRRGLEALLAAFAAARKRHQRAAWRGRACQ